MQRGGIRSTLATLFTVALVLTSGVSAQAQDAWRVGDPNFFGPKFGSFNVDYNNGRDIILIEEEGERTFDAVFHETQPWPGTVTLCPDPGQSLDCGTSTSGWVSGTVALPFCGEVVENCIEALAVGTSTSMQAATYVKSGYGFAFKGDPARGIPNGSGPAVFESSHAHSNGNQYLVAAMLNFSAEKKGIQANNFSVRVFPMVERASNLPMPEPSVCDTADGKGLRQCIQHFEECVYQVPGTCGVAQDFAPDTRVKVTLRLSNEVSGWFRGRLQAPEITVNPIDSRYSKVEVSGEPVVVPRLVSTYVTGQDGPNIIGSPTEVGHTGPFTLFAAASARGIDIVNGLRNHVKDTATAVNTVWMINSITAGQAAGGAAGCFADTSRLLGIVTTNAMAYTGTVPDYKDGYLSYRVAGMHYMPDGKTEVLGTYDLVMRSDVARCVYGFSKAPVSATIQVVGTAGEEKVATTIVNERDGWLRLAAYGFTFSEKEVRVTLTQAPQPKKVSTTLAKFGGKVTKLTSRQRLAIEVLMLDTEANSKASCTAYFVKASEKSLAIARAKSACAYAKTLNPKLAYTSVAKQTKTASLNGRVVLASN
ncbi:MAG: hypothetical protein RIS08_254 [Actinomycetota bacterium]|jgi:hypothetical protein